MKRLAVPFLSLVLTTGLRAQEPHADQILRRIRAVAAGQNQELTGHLRMANRPGRIPVGLFLMGNRIQFTFENPRTGKWTPFEMRLQQDRWRLLEMRNGKPVEAPPAKLAQSIGGTDVAYEDLAMHFLYWPKGTVEGLEKIKGRNCWMVRVENPGRGGNYRIVYIWADKKSGALMRVVGYDGGKTARPLKEFEVTEFQKAGDSATLQQIKVTRFDPRTKRATGITYLDFDKPKVRVPGGLR